MILVGVLALIFLIFGFVVFRGAPYVPSHHREARGAFEELYKIGSKDILVDVGSGDGIILRLATKQGAKAVGYELNPILVALSRFLSRNDKKVRVVLADFWLKKLPNDTTIVYAFTVSRDSKKLAEKLQNEATRLDRDIYLMTYGARLKSKTELRKWRGHYLYLFSPLQQVEA
jgi:hypothetical protein